VPDKTSLKPNKKMIRMSRTHPFLAKQRSRRLIMLLMRFRDLLPQPLPPLLNTRPPPPISPLTSTVVYPSIASRVLKLFTTSQNAFGLFRQYYSEKPPPHPRGTYRTTIILFWIYLLILQRVHLPMEIHFIPIPIRTHSSSETFIGIMVSNSPRRILMICSASLGVPTSGGCPAYPVG
jgi:hypothetical protein